MDRNESISQLCDRQAWFVPPVFFTLNPPALRILSAALVMQTQVGGRLRRGSGHVSSWKVHQSHPTNLWVFLQQGSPRGPAANHRSMAVIREGNYTHNLFNGPQVQQRREAHKDPDQGGLLLHRREQEVQEHIRKFLHLLLLHHRSH